MNHRVKIVGIGNESCGDDAVGLMLARHLASRFGAVVKVTEGDAGLWRVLDGSERAELLVIIDAAHENALLPAGQWRRIRFPEDAALMASSELRDTHSLNFDLILRLAPGDAHAPARGLDLRDGGAEFPAGRSRVRRGAGINPWNAAGDCRGCTNLAHRQSARSRRGFRSVPGRRGSA